MEKFLKKTGWTNTITSLVFAIIGLILMLKADIAIKVISYILGGLFIGMGVIKFINFFSSRRSGNIENTDFVYGVIASVLGLVIIFNSGAIEFIFRVVVGFWILYSGALRVSLAIKLNKMGLQIWTFSLVMAILTIFAGIVIIFVEGAIIKIIGILIFIYAILDLIQTIISVKNINNK